MSEKMRETDDSKYQPNRDEKADALFRQAQERDVHDNPGRYLSSYDLEKYQRETPRKPAPPTAQTTSPNGKKEPSRQGENRQSRPSSSKSKPQSSRKPEKPAGRNGGGLPRVIIIGLIAVIAVIAAAVAVHCIGREKPAPINEEQTQTAEKTYTDIFEDTLFFGNSYFITLKTYDIPRGGHFLCKVGLSINQALDYTDDSGSGVIDVLKTNGYGHLVLAFGENELGWPAEKTFTDEYVALIEAVRKVDPEIKIYVLSVLPVSAKVDAENEDETNNVRIREFNEYIRIMAEEQDVVFIPPAKELYDSDLNLRSEDSTDGVHLSYEYAKLWVDDIKAIMERNEQ